MFKHTAHAEAQACWPVWQGTHTSHTRLAEASITLAVIAYFASFLLSQLLLA